jgi:NAD(P)H dehydrogenase (quinone)
MKQPEIFSIKKEAWDMGHILVLYHSKSGNTKKMAAYTAEGASEIPGMDVKTLSVKEAKKEDIYWADGIAVGSPTQLGTFSAEMKRFWEEITPEWEKIDGKIGCAFSSEGGWGGGAELTCQALLLLMMNFGFLVFGVPDYTGDQFTLHYGVTLAGEPKAEEEIAACRRLGRRLAEWVAVYIDGRKEYHPVKADYRK